MPAEWSRLHDSHSIPNVGQLFGVVRLDGDHARFRRTHSIRHSARTPKLGVGRDSQRTRYFFVLKINFLIFGTMCCFCTATVIVFCILSDTTWWPPRQWGELIAGK